MAVVQTAGLPPNQGNICLLSSGCTWNNKNALVNIVNAKGKKLQGLEEFLWTAWIMVCLEMEIRGLEQSLIGHPMRPGPVPIAVHFSRPHETPTDQR